MCSLYLKLTKTKTKDCVKCTITRTNVFSQLSQVLSTCIWIFLKTEILFFFKKIGEVRSLFVQQTRIAATFDCCVFFYCWKLKKKIKGQMGWPYAYARGFTKLQMTKTGLTSCFTSREVSLWLMCFVFMFSRELNFLFQKLCDDINSVNRTQIKRKSLF